MRKYILFIALLAAACAKEPFKPLVLTASPEETAKSSLSGTTVQWSAGDQIAAYVGGVPYPSSSTVISGTSAQFTFDTLPAEADVDYAVYPASAAGSSWSAGITIPSEQTAVANSFAEGACVSFATGNGEPSTVFKNVCGFLAFSINADGVQDVRILANEPMTGTVDIDYNDGNPVATPHPTQCLTGVHLAGPFTKGVTYYAAVLPGSYTGLTLKLTHADGYISTYTNGNTLTVVRNDNLCITPETGIGLRTVTSGWFEKDPFSIEADIPVLIVGKVGGEYRAILNTAGGAIPSAATTVMVSGSKLSGDPEEGFKWNISKSGSTFTLYPNGTSEAWLYCSTEGSSFKENMHVGVPGQGETDRHLFAWDAAGHIHTSDNYPAYYLSYDKSKMHWDGENYPAYGSAAYPAAVFSFYVQVP